MRTLGEEPICEPAQRLLALIVQQFPGHPGARALERVQPTEGDASTEVLPEGNESRYGPLGSQRLGGVDTYLD